VLPADAERGDVEALAEVHLGGLPGQKPGGAWPPVHSDEVVLERRRGASEAAGGRRTVARPVLARPEVELLVVVDRPGNAAVGGVGARHPDRL
jgi:hypothetical protein